MKKFFIFFLILCGSIASLAHEPITELVLTSNAIYPTTVTLKAGTTEAYIRTHYKTIYLVDNFGYQRIDSPHGTNLIFDSPYPREIRLSSYENFLFVN